MNELNFSAGGRLQREQDYVRAHLGDGAGATNQMLIQTPRDDGGLATVLTPEALLTHMSVIKRASRVVVERDDT